MSIFDTSARNFSISLLLLLSCCSDMFRRFIHGRLRHALRLGDEALQVRPHPVLHARVVGHADVERLLAAAPVQAVEEAAVARILLLRLVGEVGISTPLITLS
jgi:hypothetical protein